MLTLNVVSMLMRPRSAGPRSGGKSLRDGGKSREWESVGEGGRPVFEGVFALLRPGTGALRGI